MSDKHILQLLQSNVFPKNAGVESKLSTVIENSKNLPLQQKKEAALLLVKRGEALLFKENLLAFELFETALKIYDAGPEVYYNQGMAFLKFGQQKKKEKAFSHAQKNFKKALEFNPQDFYFQWRAAIATTEIGSLKNDSNLLNEAKNRFFQAKELCPPSKKGEFNWDLARLWMAVAESSGEACDFRMAIQSFSEAKENGQISNGLFWQDFGNACFKLSLLLNDDSIYLQAIDHFKKAIETDPSLTESFFSIACAYKELYLTTFNPRYFQEADLAFQKVTSLIDNDWETWLEWAELLKEEGKLKEEPKKLKSAIEKCVKAQNINQKHPLAICYWVESLAILGALESRLDYINEAESKVVKALDYHEEVPELWLAFGICMLAYSDYYEDPIYDDLAMEKFQTGLSINRMNGKLWHEMGIAHFRLANFCDDKELYEKADKFFKKALALKPKDPALIFDYANNLLCLGEKNQNIELLKQASLLFENLLSSQKETLLNLPKWLFCHGKCLAALGNFLSEKEDSYYLQAIETFYNVLLIDPDFPNIHYYLGYYFAAMGNLKGEIKYYNRALSYFQSAVKQDEENDIAFLEWGLTLTSIALISEEENAAQYYHMAEEKLLLAGQLGNQEACYNIGCLYSLTGRYEEAVQFLEKSKELGTLPPVEEMMDDEWLENLKNFPKFCEFISSLEKKV